MGCQKYRKDQKRSEWLRKEMKNLSSLFYTSTWSNPDGKKLKQSTVQGWLMKYHSQIKNIGSEKTITIAEEPGRLLGLWQNWCKSPKISC